MNISLTAGLILQSDIGPYEAHMTQAALLLQALKVKLFLVLSALHLKIVSEALPARKHPIIKSYARPLRLLPAEEVKVSSANPSFTVTESRSLYKVKLQTSNVFGSGISDMNARVLICLIDDKGDSVLQTIPATLSRNDEIFKFQRGSVDEFTFLGLKLSKIRAVWISLESGQWRVGGASSWVVKRPVLGETNVEEVYCYRYDFEVDDILLGESSDLSMVELRPSRITELTDSHQISSSSAPCNIGSTVVSNKESMEEYANLKLPLLLYDALLILLGSSVFSFSLAENSAVAFFFGGTFGFLYLLLLQRSVDELQGSAVVLAAFKPLKDGS
ncbi:hypothetical protein HID58_057654 [Brassica napus]|uniref:DUF7755 domain-containing protein n=1 Tax=Brassica napus TaxID=3708 RepID=A0ABQ8AT69_BRANA|nr:hypothetical protein HID58_057654 [Brassica napus]